MVSSIISSLRREENNGFQIGPLALELFTMDMKLTQNVIVLEMRTRDPSRCVNTTTPGIPHILALLGLYLESHDSSYLFGPLDVAGLCYYRVK